MDYILELKAGESIPAGALCTIDKDGNAVVAKKNDTIYGVATDNFPLRSHKVTLQYALPPMGHPLRNDGVFRPEPRACEYCPHCDDEGFDAKLTVEWSKGYSWVRVFCPCCNRQGETDDVNFAKLHGLEGLDLKEFLK